MYVHAIGTAAMIPTARIVSQRTLAPDMNSIPARIAARTSDVPRSGWSRTRSHAGTIRAQAPRIVQIESSDFWRLAM